MAGFRNIKKPCDTLKSHLTMTWGLSDDLWCEHMPYILTKKGKAAKTIPARIRMYRFEIKYGIAINPIPQKKGIIVFCFLP